jgi:ABC-2 type transport system ATP-binding protein
LDAENRAVLMAELTDMGLSYTVNGHITVPFQGSAQEIINKSQTELTTLRIHEPSLEDAYIEFIGRDAA